MKKYLTNIYFYDIITCTYDSIGRITLNVVCFCLENTVNLGQSPKFFDSFHTLNVWTHFGQLMKAIYTTFNNDRPYVNPKVHLMPNDFLLSEEEVLSCFAKQENLTVRFYLNRRSNPYFFFVGRILGMHKVTPTAFVLTLEGNVFRHTREEVLNVPVTVVCLYDTGNFGCNTYGFALIPELVCHRLDCGRE